MNSASVRSLLNMSSSPSLDASAWYRRAVTGAAAPAAGSQWHTTHKHADKTHMRTAATSCGPCRTQQHARLMVNSCHMVPDTACPVAGRLETARAGGSQPLLASWGPLLAGWGPHYGRFPGLGKGCPRHLRSRSSLWPSSAALRMPQRREPPGARGH